MYDVRTMYHGPSSRVRGKRHSVSRPQVSEYRRRAASLSAVQAGDSAESQAPESSSATRAIGAWPRALKVFPEELLYLKSM